MVYGNCLEAISINHRREITPITLLCNVIGVRSKPLKGGEKDGK
jgi:hypothetical protein